MTNEHDNMIEAVESGVLQLSDGDRETFAAWRQITAELDQMTAAINYKTHGQFRYNPSNPHSEVDLMTCDELPTLVGIAGFLVRQRHDFGAGCELLGLNNEQPHQWQGYATDDWLADVQTRVRALATQERRRQLREAAKDLHAVFPEEIKRQTAVYKAKQVLALGF